MICAASHATEDEYLKSFRSMRPTRSFSSDLLADRCRCSLRRPLDLELVLEAREEANVGVIELGKGVQANRFSLRPPIGWGAAIMVPISSDLKPLKTLIVSIYCVPPVAACGAAKYGYQYSQLRNCVRIFRIVCRLV